MQNYQIMISKVNIVQLTVSLVPRLIARSPGVLSVKPAISKSCSVKKLDNLL